MVEVRISVDGGQRDAVDLLAWLRRDPEARKLTVEGKPVPGGCLSDVDTIMAVVNTVTQLGALVMAIVSYRATLPRSRSPQVTFTAPGGVAVTIDNADAETIKRVWDAVNAIDGPRHW